MGPNTTEARARAAARSAVAWEPQGEPDWTGRGTSVRNGIESHPDSHTLPPAVVGTPVAICADTHAVTADAPSMAKPRPAAGGRPGSAHRGRRRVVVRGANEQSGDNFDDDRAEGSVFTAPRDRCTLLEAPAPAAAPRRPVRPCRVRTSSTNYQGVVLAWAQPS
jgi:hypothetical protein